MEPCGAYLRFFLFLSVPLPSKKFKNNKNNNKRERTEQKKKSAGEDVGESESLGHCWWEGEVLQPSEKSGDSLKILSTEYTTD